MSKGRILIVDDSNIQSAIFKDVLIKEGYSVLTAGNGREGIEVARKEQPDVIVTDLHMPVMDGFEMIKRMRQDESTKHVPIICVTATYQDIESKISTLTEAGADEYFYSPANPQEFIAKVIVMMRIRKVYLDLLEKNRQLKIFNDAAVDRETKMIELKDRIKELESQLAKKGI